MAEPNVAASDPTGLVRTRGGRDDFVATGARGEHRGPATPPPARNGRWTNMRS